MDYDALALRSEHRVDSLPVVCLGGAKGARVVYLLVIDDLPGLVRIDLSEQDGRGLQLLADPVKLTNRLKKPLALTAAGGHR